MNLKFKNKNFQQKGVVIIITTLVLGILLFLSFYFLRFTLTEFRISESQVVATKTYYLAEAGIAEAIWKLKNDPVWENNFTDETLNPDSEGNYWSDSFSRSGDLFENGSYTTVIQNTDRARGEIISTSTFTLPNGNTAQRVIKTTAFKNLASPTEDSAIFSGGSSENIYINSTYLKIFNGNLFSNHNLSIKGGSIVEVYDNSDTPPILEGQVLVNGNLDIKNSTLDNCEVKCAKNICEQCLYHTRNKKCKECPPSSASTPLVDFDSESSDSFKSRAQTFQDFGQCNVLCNGVYCDNKCIYTASDFEDFLWEVGEDGVLILNNDITYITGPVELKGGRHLIVNGALVADGTIDIGERYCWTRGGEKECGTSQITINQPNDTTPSGLLTKAKINFSLYSSFEDVSIKGVIHANDEIRLVSIPKTFNITGGIIARKLSFTSLWNWINIDLDNEIILYGLGYKIDGRAIDPVYSPIITIEHWEETY
ncbi:hypothetical protein ACFL0A_01525 [Patescibacteria group bacterium]